jgi:hypothetical protein
MEIYICDNMAKLSESRSEVSNVIEQPSAVEVLRKAGLDPAKMKPFERNYLATSLSTEMATWKKEGKPVELEAARWLEGKLAQKHEFLTNTKAPSSELEATEADMQRVHERINALEKTELVARKTETPGKTDKFPYGMMPKQVVELEKMGVKLSESTWEQRRAASVKSMYKNPFETREGREEEIAEQKRREQVIATQGPRKPMPSFRTQEDREREAMVKEEIARFGPRKANPFLDESRIKAMPNVQEELMANSKYKRALEDQNSNFSTNQKTAADMVKDAMALARNPKADIGSTTSLYAYAVKDYSKVLSTYSKDSALGSDPKERMFAGLVAQEREMRIALAERPKPTLELPNVEAELISNESYKQAIDDHNGRFPANQKTARDLINDALAIAGRRKAFVGPDDSPYAIAVAGYASLIEGYAKDRKLGSTTDERILAGLRSQDVGSETPQQQTGPVIAQKKARTKEPAVATVHKYELTVAGLGDEEKSTTYRFSTTVAIDTKAFRHAIDTSNPEEAHSNLAALGVRDLTDKEIAEIREGYLDPAARIEFAEIKARKGTKG